LFFHECYFQILIHFNSDLQKPDKNNPIDFCFVRGLFPLPLNSEERVALSLPNAYYAKMSYVLHKFNGTNGPCYARHTLQTAQAARLLRPGGVFTFYYDLAHSWLAAKRSVHA
jgi:hypothetical protein